MVQAGCRKCREQAAAPRPVHASEMFDGAAGSGSSPAWAPLAVVVEEACALLRRAALVIATYESAPRLEHAHDDDLLLVDIGAFLVRVDPR